MRNINFKVTWKWKASGQNRATRDQDLTQPLKPVSCGGWPALQGGKLQNRDKISADSHFAPISESINKGNSMSENTSSNPIRANRADAQKSTRPTITTFCACKKTTRLPGICRIWEPLKLRKQSQRFCPRHRPKQAIAQSLAAPCRPQKPLRFRRHFSRFARMSGSQGS